MKAIYRENRNPSSVYHEDPGARLAVTFPAYDDSGGKFRGRRKRRRGPPGCRKLFVAIPLGRSASPPFVPPAARSKVRRKSLTTQAQESPSFTLAPATRCARRSEEDRDFRHQSCISSGGPRAAM